MAGGSLEFRLATKLYIGLRCWNCLARKVLQSNSSNQGGNNRPLVGVRASPIITEEKEPDRMHL